MPHESHPTPEPDELADRLIDGSLRELLGGAAPPDLSQRILSAACAPAPVALITAGGSAMNANQPSPTTSRFPWISIAIAVCLMVGAAFLLLPSLPASREQAAATAAANNKARIESKFGKSLPENSERLAVKGAAADYAIDAYGVSDPSENQQGAAQHDGEGSLMLGMAVNSDAGVATGARGLSSDGGPAVLTGEGMGIADQAGRGQRSAEKEVLLEQLRRPDSLSLAKDPSRRVQSAGEQAGAGQGQGQGGAQADFGSLGDIIAAPASGGEQGNGNHPILLGTREAGAQPATIAPAPAQLTDESLYAAPAATPAPIDGLASSEGELAQLHAAAASAPSRGLAIAGGARGGMGGGGSGGDRFGSAAAGATIEAGRAYRSKSESAPGEETPLAAVVPNYTVDLDLAYRRGLTESGFGGGRGPQAGGDQYARIVDNPFRAVSAANTDNRLSTFSIDVDTASYANTRQFLMQAGTLPPPDAVRIEELVNYFDYKYSAPTGDVPFASNVEVSACPWAPEHRLVRVGIKGREMDRARRPKSNIVFLIDVSGSMDEPAKLPLLVEGMKMLTRELGENDRVAIVVYASSEGMALDSTRGDQQQTILDALGRLQAGGSTAGGAGIQLAYKVAEQNFIKDGVNRIILCTDGDFNVGVTSPAELQRLAEEKAKDTGVFLTVIGFGRGNLNDAMMEAVADHGNGNYHYVDNRREARKVLVEEMTGTLVTIAKDVKIQIEFNPAKVAGYRLIGYENRVLAAEDFNNDKKDAGEIGAGHTVTALYEIVPTGLAVNATGVDELKYGPKPADIETTTATGASGVDDLTQMSDELLTLKIRYKQPDGDTSEKLEFPITDNDQKFSTASQDFQFAASVASFGMLLRQSEFKGSSTFAGVLEIAESASRDRDPHGYRREFVEMVQRAKDLAGQ